MVIWKFSIRLGTGTQHVDMPAGAKILSIDWQGTGPRAWTLCDPSAPMAERRLLAAGTGDELVQVGQYVATVHAAGSVVHYFDLGEFAKPTSSSKSGDTSLH